MNSNIKRLLALIVVAVVCAGSASAQGFLKRLGEKALDKVKNKVENKIDNIVDKGADAVLNGKKKKKKAKEEEYQDADEQDEQEPQVKRKKQKRDYEDVSDADGEEEEYAPEVAQNVKSDFVRGSVVLFEDNFAGEQMGEFPSKWDINSGAAETASVNGRNYINLTSSGGTVAPLMENMSSYLPDVFTLEWDVFCSKPSDIGESTLELLLYNNEARVGLVSFTFRSGATDAWGYCIFKKGGGLDSEVDSRHDWDQIRKYVKLGQWNHFAISFNKRALKYYINGNRVVNLPNVAAPQRFEFNGTGDYEYSGFGNIVLAKGAVDLYERKTTNLSAMEKSIAETGKFVTNNILFETGKATLKAESMEEIQKVAEYMKKNPNVRFEVQGHTDNQGSDKINDPLSQQRAEAVVKALEDLGCDGFNLRAVGKGSHEPVADNSTDPGRAKNRRVVFVKK